MITKSRYLVIGLFFFVFFSLFPIFQYYGMSYYLILAASLLMICIYYIKFHASINYNFFIFIFFALIFSSITSIYWGGSLKISLYPLAMIIGLYYAIHLDSREYNYIVSIFTVISIIMLIGAYLGFVYALAGGAPIFSIKNPDNRTSWLYLTTFTNARIGRIIRPSGFFDEPGALSFFICITAMLRNINKRNSKITLLLLFTGFITLSLAHLVYVIFHLLSMSYKKKSQIKNLLIIFTAFMTFLFTTNIGNTIFLNIFNRVKTNLELNSSNKDIRISQFQNAYKELLSSKVDNILFSLDPYFMDKDHFIAKREYPRIGENLLTPLSYYGILISWVYYFYLFYLILYGLKNRENRIFIGLAMLLIQRPYITAIGYSAIIFLPFFMNRKIYKMQIKLKKTGKE